MSTRKQSALAKAVSVIASSQTFLAPFFSVTYDRRLTVGQTVSCCIALLGFLALPLALPAATHHEVAQRPQDEVLFADPKIRVHAAHCNDDPSNLCITVERADAPPEPLTKVPADAVPE